MLSILLYGRNDSHGYNLHKRAAISLNAMDHHARRIGHAWRVPRLGVNAFWQGIEIGGLESRVGSIPGASCELAA